MKINKNIIITISTVLLICFQAWSQTPKILVGRWKTDKDPNLSVEFYLASDGKYYGRVSDQKDPHYGKIVFSKMVYNEPEKTYEGTLNPPDKDISLNAVILIENSSKLKVTAKKFMMTKVIYFSKIN